MVPKVEQGWRPISTAPRDGTEILVTGESGHIPPHSRFYINAHVRPGYRQGMWLDATGTRLADAGWEPLWWMPLPEPPA
jgi:hypothetical protein